MTKMVTMSKSRKRMKYFEEEQEDNTELLPGLPNDVTVQLISTKLPWRTFFVLSSVSRAWLGEIRSGKINDIRVRSRTAETLAVVSIDFNDLNEVQGLHSGEYAIALYSLRDKAFYRLPPRPAYERAIPAYWRYVTTGGKIYIFGGLFDSELWVLDVAGQKKWQECASLLAPRTAFGCAVFEGKLYIFGGWNLLNGRRAPIDNSEVYDPKVDAWTKISPMRSVWLNFETSVVRDEILVHGGRDGSCNRVNFVEAYNPAKDSWRTIPPGDFGKHEFGTNEEKEKLFTAHGRLHSLTQSKIVVFDFDKKTVKDLHRCSVESRSNICSPPGRFWPHGVLATDDGLLTKGRFRNNCRPPCHNNDDKLYQSGSRQLGMGEKKIVLEEVESSQLVRFKPFSVVQPIQL